ncbi:piggyBac transposable element-derived protein 4 isoform X4 [Diabrotica virgifera virgifera]|uniref:ZAD domain-containing protein n=1 Tax=Diabrotica virgifera virgifera TaxID=50390 RepID=A0ABM5JWT1_DIAVI|nr:piggyBac transposable element-derived protein 4 isoform X4 [Diabrotica virgifera virgifera]
MNIIEQIDNKETKLQDTDFPHICRICQSRNNLLAFEEQSSLMGIFKLLTNIEVIANPDMPQNVCNKCISKLQSIENFIAKCIETENMLLRLLPNKQIEIKTEIVEPEDDEPMDTCMIELIKNEIQECEVTTVDEWNMDSNHVQKNVCKTEPIIAAKDDWENRPSNSNIDDFNNPSYSDILNNQTYHFMARRPLVQSQFETNAEDLFFEPDLDDEHHLPAVDSEFSEEEIEEQIENSASEQENTSDESDEEKEIMEEFFVGKNKSIKWRKKTYLVSAKTKAINKDKIPTGLTHRAVDIKNELDAFLQIFDLSMIDDTLKYTNMYIDEELRIRQYPRDRDCKNIERHELMAYFGLLYLIGIKKSHHANMKEMFAGDGTGIGIARAVMGHKRFLFITRCLRFDDKNTRSERKKVDKLAAIREFFQAFVNNCKSSYNLGEYTTIDEMLQPFRGRCSFIQYMPSKPAKYGVKIFALCDARSFYTSNLEIYCGKQPDGPFATSNTPTDIVKRLISPIEYSNRNLTIDNWYTSLPLAEYLLSKKITVLGAIKKNNSEIPKEFLPNKRRDVQSTLLGFQEDKMMISYVPRKNKAVILLSTLHDDNKMDPDTKKPQAILDYNETKGGVDIVDKMCAAYSVSRKTRRWPCVIFYTLINIGGINAQILHKLACPAEAPKYRRVFLKNLALNLMKEHLIFRSTLKHLPRDISAFLKVTYGQEVEPTKEEQNINPPKRGVCRQCVMEKKRSSASMKCCRCQAFTCKKHSAIEVVCSFCKDENVDSDQ